MTISFEVPGEPKGKGRPRFAKRGDFVQTYTPEGTASYENLVKVMYYNAAGAKKLEGPISMEAAFYFGIPKSKPKKTQAAMRSGQIKPTIKCDIDNIVKIVLDGLNKVAFDDDKQIVALKARKEYSETPRMVITLSELDERS